MARAQEWVPAFAKDVTAVLAATNTFLGLNAEYVALDLGNTEITDQLLIDGGFTFTKDQLLSAISSMAAIQALLGQGHATNLFKVKQGS